MKNDEEDSNFLNILSLNVRSTSSIDKFNEFRGMVLKLKCILAIIAVQETWFNEGNIKLYRIEGFSLINCCRDDEYGGTTVYIREDIKYGIINNQSHDFVDVMMFCLPNNTNQQQTTYYVLCTQVAKVFILQVHF